MPWFNLYLIGVNFLLFLLIGIDKSRARKNQYRISEQTLLVLGLVGGGLAGWIAMLMFRHKTRKKLFHVVYWISIVLTMLFLWKNSIIMNSL